MQTELYSVSKIFTEALFRIPDYQRGYAWGMRQLKDFWTDIEQLEPDKDHYTGVLTFEDVSKESYSRWEDDLWIIEAKKYRPYYVVDGQQRLTTIAILLQTLVERLKPTEKLNYTDTAKIREKFIFESKDGDISRSYIFGYEKDNPSYEFLKTKIFLEKSSEHSAGEETIYTHNLSKAKEFFSKIFAELDIKALEATYTKVTQHLLFNIYAISKEIDVFVAFETMNNRGKPLSHLELLKTRLIWLSTKIPNLHGHDREKIRKTINESWKTVYHVLGKNSARPLADDSFLWVHYQNYFAESITHAIDKAGSQDAYWQWRHIEHFKTFLLDDVFNLRNLSTPIAGQERPFHITSKFLNRYAMDLKSGAEIYFYIQNPELATGQDEERMWLDRLRRLNMVNSVPLTYLLFSISIDTKVRTTILKQIEFMLFIRTLWGRQQISSEIDLQQLALSLASKALSIEDVSVVMTNAVEAIKKEIEASSLKDIARDKGFYGWRAVKYFLFEYEMYLRGRSKTERFKIKWDEFEQENFPEDYSSVEHIYPQKATDIVWKNAFDQFKVKERNVLRHSLGNLLPLSRPKNSSLRNKIFEEKKSSPDGTIGYRFGGYCENEVAQHSEWDAAAITLRGIRLLEFLELRWDLKLGSKADKLKQLGLEFVLDKYPDLLKQKK
jgi:hypothetical protein